MFGHAQLMQTDHNEEKNQLVISQAENEQQPTEMEIESPFGFNIDVGMTLSKVQLAIFYLY
jgi:hypothetical protein